LDRGAGRLASKVSASRLWQRHFARRIDPFTSAILVFPLFLTYQIGILAGARGRNGADLITSWLIRVCENDLTTYLQLLLAMGLGYFATLFVLRKRGTFHARAFLPMLAEAAVYGFFMGAVIQLVIVRFFPSLPSLGLLLGHVSAGEIAVISAGAGLHEELVFRALLLGGMARLFSLPLGRGVGFVLALAISSLLFSAVHHLGPGGEPFTALAFVYRALAGVLFGGLYWVRGFAVVAWTHALYDVFVFSFS